MKLRKKKLQRKLDWWWKGVIDRTTREPIRPMPRWMEQLIEDHWWKTHLPEAAMEVPND